MFFQNLVRCIKKGTSFICRLDHINIIPSIFICFKRLKPLTLNSLNFLNHGGLF